MNVTEFIGFCGQAFADTELLVWNEEEGRYVNVRDVEARFDDGEAALYLHYVTGGEKVLAHDILEDEGVRVLSPMAPVLRFVEHGRGGDGFHRLPGKPGRLGFGSVSLT